MTNNFMSTFPPTSLTLDKNQQSFDEDIIPTNISSSTLDISSNIKDFTNTDINSVMDINHQQNQGEEFNRELFIKNDISLRN